MNPARSMDAPSLALAGVGLLVGLLVTIGGLVARDGDITRFVVAGELSVDAGGTDPDLAIANGSGYDGQYYYRLAIEPFSTADRVAGVRFDLPSVRQQRIVYPVLAGLFAGFDPGRVPSALVGVNLLAYALIGFAAAVRARQLGRSAWAGLAIVIFPGFMLVQLFSLSGILAAGLLLLSLNALSDRRGGLATALLTVAMLTRETVLVVAGAIVLVGAWDLVRRSSDRRSVPIWVGLVPLAIGVAWQLVIEAMWGTFPFQEGAALNIGLPFSGAVTAIRQAIEVRSGQSVASAVVVVALWLGVGMVARSLPRTTASRVERTAWLAAVAVMSLLTPFMYSGPQHYLRAFMETFVLGAIVVIGDHTVGIGPAGDPVGAPS